MILDKNTILAELDHLLDIFQRNGVLNICWKSNPFYMKKDKNSIKSYLKGDYNDETNAEVINYVYNLLMTYKYEIKENNNEYYLNSANNAIEDINKFLIINQLQKIEKDEDCKYEDCKDEDYLVLLLENITRIPEDLNTILRNKLTDDKIKFDPKKTEISIQISFSVLTKIPSDIINNINLDEILIRPNTNIKYLTVDSNIYNLIKYRGDDKINVINNQTTNDNNNKAKEKNKPKCNIM